MGSLRKYDSASRCCGREGVMFNCAAGSHRPACSRAVPLLLYAGALLGAMLIARVQALSAA